MLIPLRFSIEMLEGQVPDPDPPSGIPGLAPAHRIEIELYDTDRAEPVARRFELLHAVELPLPTMGVMRKTVLEPGPLSEDHRAYLLELRDAVDGLLQSGWRNA